MIAIPVRHLLTDQEYKLALKIIAGKKGLPQKKITIPQIQKPGLALTGDISNLHPGRVQVLGNAEIRYLKNLSRGEQKKVIHQIGKVNIACIVLTHGNNPPPALKQEMDRQGIPLFQTSIETSTFILRITKFLSDRLTETTTIHGVLVDVFGVGILLTGKSGIGKSECALELVMKGHRLVADDVVLIRKKPPELLYGSGHELIKYHMEIRGLGIINIKDLFGVAAVRDQKLVELILNMVEWDPKEHYDRLGIDNQYLDILGVPVPLLRIPVRPGRSLTTVIEVAARNQLLKQKGVYSAHELQEKLTKKLLMNEKDEVHLRDLV